MLTGRFHQKPSDRWIGGVPPGPEDGDSAFNVMSPTGRNRPFKGIVLPNKRIGSIPWESTHPVSISNTIASNSSSRHHRDHRNNSNDNSAWGMYNEEHYGIHVPQNSSSLDGVAFVYNKGPAGQTPFPTLVAMPGYFPLGQVLASTPQSPPPSSSSTSTSSESKKQGQEQNSSMDAPFTISSLDYVQPSLDSVLLNDFASETASRT